MLGIVAVLTCGFSKIDTVLGKVPWGAQNSVCFPTSTPLRHPIRIPTNQKVSCSMIWSIAPGTGLKCSEHSVLSWHMITDHWIVLPHRGRCRQVELATRVVSRLMSRWAVLGGIEVPTLDFLSPIGAETTFAHEGGFAAGVSDEGSVPANVQVCVWYVAAAMSCR